MPQTSITIQAIGMFKDQMAAIDFFVQETGMELRFLPGMGAGISRFLLVDATFFVSACTKHVQASSLLKKIDSYKTK